MVNSVGRSVGTVVISSTKTTLYTVPKQMFTVVNYAFVVNNSTGDINFNFAWTDSSSTDTEYDRTISSTLIKKTHEYFTWPLPMDEGDTLNVTKSTTLTCNITLNIDEEYTERVQR